MAFVLFFALLASVSASGPASAAGPEARLGPCAEANAVLALADGKTVVVAQVHGCGYGGGPGSLAVARLEKDGSLDGTFGNGGVRVVRDETATDAALAPDGKILIAGESRLYRLTADGSLDPAFGDRGSVPLELANNVGGRIWIQPGGRIFVGGVVDSQTGGVEWRLLALKPDGSPDPGFAGGLPLTPRFDGFDLMAVPSANSGSLGFGPDGEVYIGFGWSTSEIGRPSGYPGGTGHGLAVLKLDAAGQPDPTYGNQGIAHVTDVTRRLEFGFLSVLSTEVAPDGSIAIYGNDYGNPEIGSAAQYAYRAAIGPDGTDPVGPISLIDQRASQFLATDLEVGPEGSVSLAASPSPEMPDDRMMAMRFLATGEPEAAFGSGTVGERIGFRAIANAVALPPGGGLTLTGFAVAERCDLPAGIGFCNSVIALSRYTSSGTLDPTFGDGGVVTFPRIHCASPGPADEPHACGDGRRVRPRITADFSNRRLSKLTVTLRPKTAQPNRTSPWSSLTVTLPKPLRVLKNRRGSVKAFTGAGPKAARTVPRALTFNRRGMQLIRSATQAGDTVRIVIPRRAMKRPGAVKNRKLFVGGQFNWSGRNRPGVPSLSGRARVHLPKG